MPTLSFFRDTFVNTIRIFLEYPRATDVVLTPNAGTVWPVLFHFTIYVVAQLDIHYVEELMGDGRSEEEATLVCHTRPSSALEIHEVCSRLRWYLCEVRCVEPALNSESGMNPKPQEGRKYWVNTVTVGVPTTIGRSPTHSLQATD